MRTGYIFFILLLLHEKCRVGLAFQIPDIDFQKNNDGFRVAIPDKKGMSRVLVIVSIDQQCPAFWEYITEARDQFWSLNIPHSNPKSVPTIKLDFLIEYNGHIYFKNMVVQNSDFAVESKMLNEYVVQDNCNEVETLLASCEKSVTKANGHQVYCTGKKVFDEHFDGQTLNSSIWTKDVRILLYSGNEELVAFDDSETNSYIKDGVLHIRPTVNEDAKGEPFSFGQKCSNPDKRSNECQVLRGTFAINPPVFSARLHTRSKFDFRFGRVEIRAKLPIGDWLFPYLLLQPKSSTMDDLFPRQIKIAAARGNANLLNTSDEDVGGRRLFGGTLLWPKVEEPLENYQEKFAEKHFGSDFHVYSVTWKPKLITLAVDGNIYGMIEKDHHRFEEEMYLVIGVTVGGFWNFPDKSFKPGVKPYLNWEAKAALNFSEAKSVWRPTWNGNEELQIDYIRIYSV